MSGTTIKVAESPSEISRCFLIMKQLRDKLTAEDFEKRVAAQQKEGYRLALVESEGRVVAAAGFRILNMLWCGKTLYIDDLVTDENCRSQGFGQLLVQWLIDLLRLA